MDSRERQTKTNSPGTPGSGLPVEDSLQTTLYDLARESLLRQSQKPENDAIYRELDRIMTLNGYPKANLEGKTHINDKDLPRAWNSVRSHQVFKLQSETQSTPELSEHEQLVKQLRQQIIEETSTLPLLPGEGYYQVLERMHPDWTPEQLLDEAHRIKKINGGREILKVGERLPTATEEEREEELQRRLEEHARQGQPGGGERQPGGGERQPVNPTPPLPEGPLYPPVIPPNPNPGGPSAPEQTSPPTPGQPNQPGQTPTPGDQTPPVPNPQTPTPQPDAATLSMADAYAQLRQQHQALSAEFNKDLTGQGVIGRVFDSAKNNIGASGDGVPWYNPKRIWSGLFDSDLGSEAVSNKLNAAGLQLDEMKKAVDANDQAKFNQIYKTITNADFDSKAAQAAPLSDAAIVNGFDDSQKRGVDTTTDISAAVVAALSLRFGKGTLAKSFFKSSAAGAFLGGTSKAGLMQVDGTYANLPRDFGVGALMGGTVPIGEFAGAQLSKYVAGRMGLTVTGDLLAARIETQGVSYGTRLLSAATKSGTSGSVFGAIESPGREVIHKIEKGEAISPSELVSLSIKGAAFGFVGGTLFGAAADRVMDGFHTIRPGRVVHPKTTINGVDVPQSGVVSMDEAAKILKMDPTDFANKAASKPYDAVADAVKLYEKTGLNIRKTNPLTGHAAVPDNFSSALSTVQNVDALTADVAIGLGKKTRIVQAADEFISTNTQAVDDSFARVTADPNFQEVRRLKTAEGGAQAADEFEQKFRASFQKDLKTSMSVKRVRDQKLTNQDSFNQAQAQTEQDYLRKAADFFQDMTDPAKRARLNQLVDDIYLKFNPETISRQEIGNLLDSFTGTDRELAAAILDQSVGASSDVMLKANMQAIRSQLESTLGHASPNNVYTLGPASSGNLLGYLYRKSNSLSMSMHSLDHLAERVKGGDIPNSIVLFDDIASTSISQADQQLLQKIPNVYVVDVGAFEKSINIIDISRGSTAVAEKLQRLVKQARAVQADNPHLIPTGVAQDVLQNSVDRSATAIGANVKVLRPGKVTVANSPSATTLAGMKDVDALYEQFNIPKAQKEDIASFLSGYAGEEREVAARMLAEGAVHNSFPAMVQKSVQLHTQLQDALGKSGMSISDLVLVPDKDPGGSTHLVSYLFGRVNGLPNENFVSASGLNKLLQSGGAKNKAVAYFDDTIYSGSQTSDMLDNNVSSLMPFKRVIVASLGAYEKGIDRIRGTHLASIGKVDVATAGMHHPFYSSKHPFFSQLPSEAQYTVKNIGGSEGFGGVQGSLIWAYMYPDNNLTFFGPTFSGKVLHLPGP